ncbi:hypothetical protein AB205_0065580 [Aquarana catesbeiana]|uniref:Uncharacterized protein n=1 Tax=Aquarana catesbeiana TaxID=8400 RepID=A0A2G9SDU2_AQUCT|nr:hypothetical protein AB205_0065580 [Aquarana catesbeiana]
MSRKRIGDHGIRKLTSFMFPQDKVSVIQDGAGGLKEPREAYKDLPDAIHSEMGTAPLPSSPAQDPGSDPLTSSPAKTRMRMDSLHLQSPPDRMAAQAQAFTPFISNQALHNSMASFPTSGLPGKVFPKLRKRNNSNKSVDFDDSFVEELTVDYVFRIIYAGHRHDNSKFVYGT